jgi:HK97 family phage portal protein
MFDWLKELIQKKAPSIASRHPLVLPSDEPTYTYEQMYEEIEVVNRAVNMVVDDSAEIPVKVLDSRPGVRKGLRKIFVHNLLNQQPNPYQDINTFNRNIITDFIIDGNIFIYFDGAHMYHLPASSVTIVPSPTNFIEKYVYNSTTTYQPEDIIHIKENSFNSIYRGTSRLKPAVRNMNLILSMRKFQDNFFKNGAVPGLVLETPEILGPTLKERMIQTWQQTYNPANGGKRPMILDGGLKLKPLTTSTFQELDFAEGVAASEVTVLKAIGVPPILLDGGNNANITPNLRLYYLETVLSIVKKINFAYSRYFGYEIVEDITDIPALRPELSEQASYYATLVNGGVISPNEARVDLGRDAKPGHDDLRIPANIAGSAVDPSTGGRPTEGKHAKNII